VGGAVVGQGERLDRVTGAVEVTARALGHGEDVRGSLRTGKEAVRLGLSRHAAGTEVELAPGVDERPQPVDQRRRYAVEPRDDDVTGCIGDPHRLPEAGRYRAKDAATAAPVGNALEELSFTIDVHLVVMAHDGERRVRRFEAWQSGIDRRARLTKHEARRLLARKIASIALVEILGVCVHHVEDRCGTPPDLGVGIRDTGARSFARFRAMTLSRYEPDTPKCTDWPMASMWSLGSSWWNRPRLSVSTPNATGGTSSAAVVRSPHRGAKASGIALTMRK